MHFKMVIKVLVTREVSVEWTHPYNHARVLTACTHKEQYRPKLESIIDVQHRQNNSNWSVHLECSPSETNSS